MSTAAASGSRPTLQADTAADLMRGELVSLRDDATVAEVVATLTERGLSACPVVDEAGQPVGVVSKADILIHDREQPKQARDAQSSDAMLVRDIMTPAVFSVPLGMPAAEVVQQMVELKVHQLFVVDPAGVLIGVISALDVLAHIHA